MLCSSSKVSEHNCTLYHVALIGANKALTLPDTLVCQQNAGRLHGVSLTLQQLPNSDVSSVCLLECKELSWHDSMQKQGTGGDALWQPGKHQLWWSICEESLFICSRLIWGEGSRAMNLVLFAIKSVFYAGFHCLHFPNQFLRTEKQHMEAF